MIITCWLLAAAQQKWLCAASHGTELQRTPARDYDVSAVKYTLLVAKTLIESKLTVWSFSLVWFMSNTGSQSQMNNSMMCSCNSDNWANRYLICECKPVTISFSYQTEMSDCLLRASKILIRQVPTLTLWKSSLAAAELSFLCHHLLQMLIGFPSLFFYCHLLVYHCYQLTFL